MQGIEECKMEGQAKNMFVYINITMMDANGYSIIFPKCSAGLN